MKKKTERTVASFAYIVWKYLDCYQIPEKINFSGYILVADLSYRPEFDVADIFGSICHALSEFAWVIADKIRKNDQILGK